MRDRDEKVSRIVRNELQTVLNKRGLKIFGPFPDVHSRSSMVKLSSPRKALDWTGRSPHKL